MIAILWRYRPATGQERQFEAAYGSGGAWADLFRKAPGYIRTDLLRGNSGEYLTIDYWQDMECWDTFSASFQDQYERLDRVCDVLTRSEERLGVFSVLPEG